MVWGGGRRGMVGWEEKEGGKERCMVGRREKVYVRRGGYGGKVRGGYGGKVREGVCEKRRVWWEGEGRVWWEGEGRVRQGEEGRRMMEQSIIRVRVIQHMHIMFY